MKKILLVIDMQNDFIDGSLGTKEAEEVVPNVLEKIKTYPKENIYATRDTHHEDYLSTLEGKYLPVVHCIEGTEGWKIREELAAYIDENNIINKPTFGSVDLAEIMKKEFEQGDMEIEIIGLCTDICVISNALLIKATIPECNIKLDPSCCAGVTPEKHTAAIETMRSCQIEII